MPTRAKCNVLFHFCSDQQLKPNMFSLHILCRNDFAYDNLGYVMSVMFKVLS